MIVQASVGIYILLNKTKMTSTTREISILVTLENLLNEKKLKKTLAHLPYQKECSLQNHEGKY